MGISTETKYIYPSDVSFKNSNALLKSATIVTKRDKDGNQLSKTEKRTVHLSGDNEHDENFVIKYDEKGNKISDVATSVYNDGKLQYVFEYDNASNQYNPKYRIDTSTNENGVKSVIKRAINDDRTIGKIVSNKKYDEQGNTIKFANTINGKLDEYTYQGNTNDCYLLSGLNALNRTPKGKQIIKEAISVDNKKGTVTVNFKGVGKSYTFSLSEIQKHDTDSIQNDEYSNGDNDMLVCPSKFRDKERERNLGVVTLKGEQPCGADDAAQGCDTRLDLELAHEKLRQEPGFMESLYGSAASEIDNSSLDYGTAVEIYMALTGVRYELPSGVDNALNSVVNNPNYALTFSLDGRKDCSATTIDGETFSFDMDGYHSFSITDATADTVTFINPWNSSKSITMSRSEFKKLGVEQFIGVNLQDIE